MLRPLVSLAASAALAIVPVAAQAAPDRAAAPASAQSEELLPGVSSTAGAVFGLLVFALIFLLFIDSGDDDEEPDSP